MGFGINDVWCVRAVGEKKLHGIFGRLDVPVSMAYQPILVPYGWPPVVLCGGGDLIPIHLQVLSPTSVPTSSIQSRPIYGKAHNLFFSHVPKRHVITPVLLDGPRQTPDRSPRARSRGTRKFWHLGVDVDKGLAWCQMQILEAHLRGRRVLRGKGLAWCQLQVLEAQMRVRRVLGD